MQKRNPRRLDFEVDELTSSIKDTLTGEVFETEVVRLREEDRVRIRKLKWAFDWGYELSQPGQEVYALITKVDPSVWHGLASASDRQDHVFMHLIESAPTNRGKDKLYSGVPANLVAFLCKRSFEKGYEGALVFEPKTRLIDHYRETLGAQLFRRNQMLIDTPEAHALVKRYFPSYDDEGN